MGFSGMFSSLALLYTAFSVRPSFNPITRVGVLCLAKSSSLETSPLVHGFPVFLVYFGIILTSSFFYCSLTFRIATIPTEITATRVFQLAVAFGADANHV